MRDCKGIKILLAICPSSHSGEDFLPQPEVFWNLRLSHTSFLLSLFLLSWFPAHWASCHFHCSWLSSCSASTTGAFAELGFCCAWPPSWAEVISARLNPRNGTMYFRGISHFLGSVSPPQTFEVMDGPVLQLSFIWQAKENTSLRHEGGPTQKKWREENLEAQFWLLFLYVFFSSPRARPM